MDTVRFGVLGCAKIARTKVVPALQAAGGCEVVALASRDLDRARHTADALGVAHAHGSYEDLLADPDVDAVYIPLPNDLHAPWTEAAAAAGKHVLCEKPLAMSAAEAARTVAACRDAGVVLAEAFMYRLHPTWQRVRALVDDGRIGTLRSVHVRFAYANDDPANIRNQAVHGGGALMDIGCYAIDVARWLHGGEPRRVEAAITVDDRFGTDVLTSALLVFDGGHATFTVATQAEPDQAVHVLGSTGRIDVPVPFNVPPRHETRIDVTAGGDPPTAPDTETLAFAPADQYTLQGEAFARAVTGTAPYPRPAEEAIATARVIEQVFAAAGAPPGWELT